ncbi:glycerol kinase GlpK [Hoeflea poritis]|uniref:Glycerol kinase n=1 Tax=Hoeflea poritis TaxID=2993659 RepID=A0ABT4VPA7_9HYPH|nr:glycerol kinase GlpK [Hoeflea poritis]MDA4846546.1 glycerol kinase GlpK [Hoeflea poritis]
MANHVLAIDQGTTSSRAIIFREDRTVAGVGQQEFTQHFPRSGWVEHDPEEIWETVNRSISEALEKAGLTGADIAAVGITNQRETVVVWDRETGEAVFNAIVWQDRRTASLCGQMKDDGLEPLFTRKTGLLLDPYFSGTKLRWLLDNVPQGRARAERGELCFGTVDSFLIWRLTGGAHHVTDATNASRTLMYNIEQNQWDEELLGYLQVPSEMLPEVRDSADDFGTVRQDHVLGGTPILGVAGDQQAATIGNACFEPGMMKVTYGTGCFSLLNTGGELVRSQNRLLSTIAYRLDGATTYAVEGSIFVAGAGVQWLRDGLGLINAAEESGQLAEKADPEQAVYLVPAFVGLGAPYWDADARGAMFGLTRSTGPAEIAKATLDSVCYQTHDLLTAKRGDWQGGNAQTVLRVDGGMVASDWTMQRLADILGVPVDRPEILETTALGAAWLAGQRAGVWPDMDAFAAGWARDRRFEPQIDDASRSADLAGWKDAVRRTLSRRD